MSKNTAKKDNAENKDQSKGTSGQEKKPRVVTDPNEVAQMVMRQLDAVNSQKDELTIAIKGLADLTKQLTRAYGEQGMVIRKLAERVKELEEKENKQ